MLCQACEFHFTFSHPSHTKALIRLKRSAITAAIKEGLSKPLTQNLRDELQRYETEVNSMAQASVPPCPWNIEDEIDYDLPHIAMIGVWGKWHPEGEVLPPRPWHELRESSRSSGCRICEILAVMVAYAVPELDRSAVVNSIVLLDQATCRPTSLHFNLLKNEGGKRLALLMLDLSATSSDNCARVQNPHDTLGLGTPVGTATNDRACIGLFADALAGCASDCVSRGSDLGAGWMPNRLLDVDVQAPGWDASRIRLVEKREMGDIRAVPYLTLSHRWGDASMLKLTENNLDEFKDAGVAIERLPRRFRDAVWLTRRLNCRYLWVDSLCIIQDSSDDWALESSLMSSVYTNSLCTIAAADGRDSDSSMFANRDPLVGGPLTIQNKFKGCIVDYTVLPDWVDVVRTHCALFTRAWVVQERFLSPRVLHLCPFPFYECQCGLVSEAFPNDMRNGDFDFPSFPEHQRDWLPSRDVGTRDAIERWWQIVDTYTSCSLTYESDKLVATGGMARVFSESLGQLYYAGIWGGDYLELCLQWCPGDRPISSGPPAEYRAPSWSWASVDGPVFTPSSGNVRHSVIEVLHAQINTAEGHDAFGNVTGGTSLVLRGFVFEIQDFRGRRASLKQPWMCRLDYGDEDLDLDSRIYFLPLADLTGLHARDCEPSFSGLWVQEATTPPSPKWGDSTPTFRRVGCTWGMEAGGEGHMLDEESWNFLCSHYESGVKAYGTEIRLV